MIQEITVEISDDTKLKLSKLGQTVEQYVNKLIKRDEQKTIELDNGYYYDKTKAKLFNSQKEHIKLTRLEEALFNLLLDNKNEIVSNDTIHKIAWKGKNMTRFTLRNKIKCLRDKTYYELLKNHSNIGYSMNVGE